MTSNHRLHKSKIFVPLSGALLLAGVLWALWGSGGEALEEPTHGEQVLVPYVGGDEAPKSVGGSGGEESTTNSALAPQSEDALQSQTRALIERGSLSAQQLPAEQLPAEQLSAEQPSAQQGEKEPGRSAPEPHPEGLGPVAWMAQPTDVDVEALEAELIASEMRQEFELALRADRQTSIEAAEAIVTECFEDLRLVEPAVRGRIALQWWITTEAGQGVVSDVAVLLNVGLHDEEFIDCALTGLEGLSFAAVGDGGELEVQWPVFFDL